MQVILIAVGLEWDVTNILVSSLSAFLSRWHHNLVLYKLQNPISTTGVLGRCFMTWDFSTPQPKKVRQ
jgi:hypothetical protein